MMAMEEQIEEQSDTPTVADLTTEQKAAAVESAAEKLKNSAYSVSMEIAWFSSSRSATKDEKQALVGDDGPDADMVSVQYKKLDSKNEYVRRMHDCRSAINSFRDSMTIPAAQVPVSAMVNTETNEDIVDAASDHLKKQAGKRIIMQSDVEKFEQQLHTVLIPALHAAVEDANNHIDEIREATKAKLKNKFKEEEFPDKFTVGVRGPFYSRLGLDAEFETLCPTAAARMKKVMQKQFEDTVNLAVADFATDFLSLLDLTIKQLSLRYLIRPPEGHKYYAFRGAIITGVITHKDDPEIPEDKKSYELTYKEGKQRKITVIGPLSEQEYEELRPSRSNEKGTIYASTFDQLLYNFSRFEQIREMLGDMGKPLENIVDKVQDILKCENISNGEVLAKKLKQSNYLRNEMSKSLDTMAEALSDSVSKLPGKAKPRKRAFVM